jgi:glucoamylase
MSEYITLLASVKAGGVVDTPSAACSRYDACTLAPGSRPSSLDFDVNVDATLGWTVNTTGNIPELGNWNMKLGVPTTWFADNHWKNRVNAHRQQSHRVQVLPFQGSHQPCSWETRAGNRTLTTPGAGGQRPQ